jgi:hypothetical protein
VIEFQDAGGRMLERRRDHALKIVAHKEGSSQRAADAL